MEHARRISLLVFATVICLSLLTASLYQLFSGRAFVSLSKYVRRPNAIGIDLDGDYAPPSNRNKPCSPVQIVRHQVKFYNTSSNYYEYRYELHKHNGSTGSSRLMLLLTGRNRSCIDWWAFSIGSRILNTIREGGFSIVAVCNTNGDYRVSMPLQRNFDVEGIYTTLQLWIRDVYFEHFQHYPLLYLYGVSQGSRIASLLCRVLPVQAQILYIFSGYRPSLLVRSDHSRSFQNRLSLDPTFANWFYLDYCFTKNDRCPLQQMTKNYFNPVPPTYFVHASKDRMSTLDSYLRIMADMQAKARKLRSPLLMDNRTIQLSIVQPVNITPSYLQVTFDKWLCKPWSSRFFYRLFVNPKYKAGKRTSRTCWCLKKNFLHFDRHPQIIRTWPLSEQKKYADYANDIRELDRDLCQEVCGDLLAHHSMLYKYTDTALIWLDQIDRLRIRHRHREFLRRPLRLWMYDKSDLVDNPLYLTEQTPMNTSCGRQYVANQMYSPEYFLQDWLHLLQKLYPQSRHDLIWSSDPLLADYYIIPHDCACMVAHSYSPAWNATDYRGFHTRLSDSYFLPLLANVKQRFPFWNMTSGANHLIAFALGKNMGVLQDKLIATRLQHAIQLAFTGFRSDLLARGSRPLYVHREKTPVYRHRYDILIPPFDRLQQFTNKPIDFRNEWNRWYQQKETLFFFAGTLNNSISDDSARQRLATFAREDIGDDRRYPTRTSIDEKWFNTLMLIDGAMPAMNYTQAIRSSIFHLCLEGFSPWSPRLYESISQGAIPLILAESIVLPFERFIDWRSFSTKLNTNHIKDLVDVMTHMNPFEDYVRRKLQNASRNFYAFRWPYSAIDDEHDRHVFLPNEDANGTATNVLHYLSLELRCRRLEQLHGLTSDSLSTRSAQARRIVCTRYPRICPCEDEQRSLALEEYT